MITLTTTDDAHTKVFGGSVTIDEVEGVNVSQSGGNIINGVFEFDLISLADGTTINNVTFEFTNVRFISNTPANSTAAVALFVYLGDGVVTIDDYDAAQHK